VIIDEVDTDDWGWGGLPALDYREKLAAERAAQTATASAVDHDA
jgi:4-oxalocrotonate tautomerase